MPSDEALALRESKVPLLEDYIDDGQENEGLPGRVWMESKKLWYIAGPAIFNRVANYTMIAITQAFAGHLGDLEMAATSIAMNVILGLDLGLMVYYFHYSFTFKFKYFKYFHYSTHSF